MVFIALWKLATQLVTPNGVYSCELVQCGTSLECSIRFVSVFDVDLVPGTAAVDGTEDPVLCIVLIVSSRRGRACIQGSEMIYCLNNQQLVASCGFHYGFTTTWARQGEMLGSMIPSWSRHRASVSILSYGCTVWFHGDGITVTIRLAKRSGWFNLECAEATNYEVWLRPSMTDEYSCVASEKIQVQELDLHTSLK